MRADSELGNSVESLKDETRPHHSKGDRLDGEKENAYACELFSDTKGGRLDGDRSGHRSMNNNREEVDDRLAKGDSLEKEEMSVFYMDKNVMDSHSPRIVACYEEKNTYHVVKDICVDEGVPLQEKLSSKEDDQFSSEDSMEAEANADVLTVSLESECLGISPVKDSGFCNGSKSGSDILAMHGDPTAEKLEGEEVKDEANCSVVKEEVEAAGITGKESLTLADVMSMEDGKKTTLTRSSDGPEEQSSQESSGKRSSESAAPAPSEAYETEKSQEETSSCVENVDVTDLPSARGPTRSESDDYVSRHSRFTLEDPNDHPFPSGGGGIGETSFSAAEPVSGHITYSGPISFSGSLSVRSDASTTSTRSFAFPVLQSEWNSSPVRMAKADRRHLRRQKSWRHSLLCCRF